MTTKCLVYSLRLQLFLGFVLWNFIKCDCPFPNVRINNGGLDKDKLDKDFPKILSNVPEGHILFFRCFDGYELKGSNGIQCLVGGWYGSLPSCEEMQCSEPPTISNGTYNFTAEDKITIGTQAIYSCSRGYELSDRSVSNLTCKLDEEYKEETLWAGEIPACQAMKNCSDPGVSMNGTREGECCFEGDIVRYYCNESFELVGEEHEIECLSSSRWSSPRPLCKPLKKKHCEPPPEIPNGDVLMKSGDYALAGEEAEIRCNPGYKLNGANQYPYCNENTLLWDDEFGECVEILCDRPEPLANGNIPELDQSDFTDIFPYNFMLTYDCDEGYRLRGGDSWRVCSKDGWSRTTPHCEEILCPDPGRPEHGTRLGNSFKVGAKVRFSCFTGYELLGAYERYCSQNGKWTGEIARCSAPMNFCANPGVPINGMQKGDSYNEGDVVEFSCESGFIHSGSTERTCMPDRTWNGSETKCLAPHDFDSIEEIGTSWKYKMRDEFDDEIRDFHLRLYAEGKDPIRSLNIPKNGRLIMHFAFDGSGSITEVNFKKGIKFAKAIVKKIEVSENGARVGALVFSNEALNIFFPMQFNTTEEVLVELDGIEYHGGGTATTSALQLVINNIELVENQPQFVKKNLSHVLFLITDGKANMGGSPEQEAHTLKELMKVQIFCIGITGDLRAETLHQIATTSEYGNEMRPDVFILENYKRLNWLIQDITEGTIDYGQCGIGMESKINIQDPRVVGGKAVIEPWPWMVSLFFRNPNDNTEKAQLQCGGSIINEHFILTAAHCLYERMTGITLEYRKRSAEEVFVILGLLERKNQTLMRRIEVESFYIHDDYIMDKYLDNDIALLKLSERILYGPFTRPVCLPPAVLPKDKNYPLYKPGEYGWVTGFGHEKKILPWEIFTNVKVSEYLKELRLPIQSDPTCISSLSSKSEKERTRTYTERMLCAGDGVSGNDTCRGDSGGPLMQHHINSQGQVYWTQVGIVSWGEGCGNIGYYGFYTKVHKFRTWIDDIIKKNGPKGEK